MHQSTKTRAEEKKFQVAKKKVRSHPSRGMTCCVQDLTFCVYVYVWFQRSSAGGSKQAGRRANLSCKLDYQLLPPRPILPLDTPPHPPPIPAAAAAAPPPRQQNPPSGRVLRRGHVKSGEHVKKLSSCSMVPVQTDRAVYRGSGVYR